MYCDFTWYRGHGGTVSDNTTFTMLEVRAQRIVDRYTQGRVKAMASVPSEVRDLVVELVNLESLYSIQQLINDPAVSSFSNDGVSASYAVPRTRTSVEAAEYQLCVQYLSDVVDDEGVPLLYLGVE